MMEFVDIYIRKQINTERFYTADVEYQAPLSFMAIMRQSFVDFFREHTVDVYVSNLHLHHHIKINFHASKSWIQIDSLTEQSVIDNEIRRARAT